MMAIAAYQPFTRQPWGRLLAWALALALLVLVALSASLAQAAKPPAGTVITAQAIATYAPAGGLGTENVSSNIVIAVVQPVEALTLVQNNNLLRPAGSIVAFSHLLSNAGNVSSSYTLSLDTSGCPNPNAGFSNTSIYVDVNNNGIIDSADRKLSLDTKAALTLAQGANVSLLLQGQLPPAQIGSKSCMRLVATTDGLGNKAANTDIATISSNAAVVVNKAVAYTGVPQPGTVVTYTITANNIGNADAQLASGSPPTAATAVVVDGTPMSLFLLRDPLPTGGLRYVAGSLHTDVYDALRLFRYANDAPFSYRKAPAPVGGALSGNEDSTAIEVAIGVPRSLTRNSQISMDFKTTLISSTTPDVQNLAMANYNDGSGNTESVSNISNIRTLNEALGLSKAASMPVAQVDSAGAPDGTAIVRFQLVLRNFGSGKVFNVNISDPLENVAKGLGAYTSAAIPPAGRYTVIANSVQLMDKTGAGTSASINSSFTGEAAKADLLAAGAVLPAGGSVTVQFDVRFNLSGLADTLYNSAAARASAADNEAATITASSSNGLDPDANHDGVLDAPGATPYTTRLPVLSLLKTVTPPRALGNGIYELDYSVRVSNIGLVDASNVRLVDNLACAFQMEQTTSPVESWKITSAPRALNNLLTVYAGFTGDVPCDRPGQNNIDALSSFPFQQVLNLVDGSRALASGAAETIRFTVQVKLKSTSVGTAPILTNKAWAGVTQPVNINGSSQLGGNNNGQITVLWATASSASTTLVDPSGVVYNAVTRQPVSDAIVTMTRLSCPATTVGPITASQLFGDTSIYTFNADGSASMSTDAQGVYSFIFKTPPVNDLCSYSLKVAPATGSGLSYPSKLIAPQSDVFRSCGQVTAVTGVPQAGQATTYYDQVAAGADNKTNVACEVINNNIPLDPAVANGITLQKTVLTDTAEIGDMVRYTIKVSNLTNIALPQLSVTDQLPNGFRYIPGSTRIEGARVADPAGGAGPVLTFNLPLSATAPLVSGGSMTLTYQLRVGANVQAGTDAYNRARATAGFAPSSISSNEASVRVRVQGGVFAEEAYAFGKVFMDCNKNGIHDDGELGIPGVRLFMEDGTGVVTDIEGKWSLYGLRPVTHVLRLDGSTLPDGAQVALIEPRQSGQADSLFLDLKKGEWHKANFAVQNCEAPGLMEAVTARRDTIIAQPATEAEASRVTTRLTPDGRVQPLGDVRGMPAAGTISSSGQVNPINTINSPLIALPGTIAGSDFAGPVAGDTRLMPGSVPLKPAVGAEPAPTRDASPEPTPLEDALTGLNRKIGFIGLSDNQILPSTVVNVRIKGGAGSRLVLTVNGTVVGEDRVGKRARMDGQQLEAWEYIAVTMLPGTNTVLAEEVDGFGIKRGSVQITLRAPGPLARIEVQSPETAKADERALLPIKVLLLDAQGLPVTERTPLTLESIAARWNVTDLNPMEQGVQVMVQGGSATFDLAPPANPGDGKIRISAGTLQTESRIIFLPDLRPLIGVGVVEGIINVRNPGGMPIGAPRAADAFESELRGISDHNGDTSNNARTAFYFKGAVKGDYLLTMAYDSDKTTATTMFRDIQPDQFYPIYGDSAAKTFDAQSSQRLYLRIDKNRSYLLYGDFSTASSPEVRKLSQNSRTSTGLQYVYNSGDIRATTHYSRDSLKQIIEEFPANGTSGPFALKSAGANDLFANSEIVTVQVRDRNQPNTVLRSTPLTRFVDYSIEPLSKTILLTRPVSSLDADLNPQSIRISYSVDTGGPAFDVAGVDVQLRISDRLQLGAVAEIDSTPDASRRLNAATALARLDENTILRAEVVSTRSDLRGDGQGLALELRHDDNLFKYNLQLQATDATFDNPYAGVTSGTIEMRGHLERQINPDNKLKAELVYSQDNGLASANGGTSTALQTRGISVGVQTNVSPNVITEVGLRAGQTDTSAATGFDYGAAASGSPAASTASGTTQDTVAARARVTVKLPDAPNTQVYVEAEQDINDKDRHIAAIGGNYTLNDKVRFYGRYELISSMGNEYALNSGVQRNVGLFGIEGNYMQGGRVFDEYRIADSIDGRALQSAQGIRHTYEVAEGLRLTGGLEQVSSLPGAGGTSSGESKAITGAFDWLGTGEYKGRLRGSGQIEFRDASDSTSGLVSLGLAYKLDPDWSLLTRGTANRVSNHTDGSAHWLEREQIGFAYRPVDQDVWNSLFRYEHKVDTWGGPLSTATVQVNTFTDILSAHVNVQPRAGDLLSARFAAKESRSTADGLDSIYSAQLLYGRWTHDFTQSVDFGLQAGLLLGSGGMEQHTAGAELGFQLTQGLWLSVGYNFIGLRDPDLTGADYTDSGPYLRLRFKFDERTFATGSPAANDLR